MALVALAGCGGDDEAPAAGAAGEPGEGGTLTWALDREPETLDPLLADDWGEQLVTRQIHEPLVEQLGGPFEDTRRQPGLALSARPSSDDTIWRVGLRRGVRFQDGMPFNATAVLANVERWQSVPQATGLPSGMLFDAPRPDLVRFILPAPDPAFDRRLASPSLGIVSPRALRGGGRRPDLLEPGIGSGTGAFELRERGGGRLLLARNTDWWGIARELGPALDQLEFETIPDGADRLELLSDGDAQAAAPLTTGLARSAQNDPLLTVLSQGGGKWLGLERSVRGIDSGREVPSLQAAWLTTVGPG